MTTVYNTLSSSRGQLLSSKNRLKIKIKPTGIYKDLWLKLWYVQCCISACCCPCYLQWSRVPKALPDGDSTFPCQGNIPVFIPAVFRIHDILVRIRIRRSMPPTNVSGPFYFHHWPSRCQQKTNFFKKVFFCLLPFKVLIHHFQR